MTTLLRPILAALLGLTLVACGGDDDDGAASASASVDVDLDELEEATEAADLAEGCQEAVAAFAAVAGGAGGALSGGAGDLEESIEAFEDYADDAPEEIRADIQLLAEAYGEFVRILVDSGFDPQSGETPDEEAMAALEEAASRLEQDEVDEASERVSTYFENECGVDVEE